MNCVATEGFERWVHACIWNASGSALLAIVLQSGSTADAWSDFQACTRRRYNSGCPDGGPARQSGHSCQNVAHWRPGSVAARLCSIPASFARSSQAVDRHGRCVRTQPANRSGRFFRHDVACTRITMLAYWHDNIGHQGFILLTCQLPPMSLTRCCLDALRFRRGLAKIQPCSLRSGDQRHCLWARITCSWKNPRRSGQRFIAQKWRLTLNKSRWTGLQHPACNSISISIRYVVASLCRAKALFAASRLISY